MTLHLGRLSGLVIGLALVAGCAHTYNIAPGAALAIPNGHPIEADIAAGYRTFGEALEPFGKWSDDRLYGTHWCPRGVDATTFVPYASNGHWLAPAPADEDETARAARTPYWSSDDANTWGDITMHHGWWVQVDQSSPTSLWCWVPGLEETQARVVWREADGFVAWAPEPPLYEDDADRAVDSLAWMYSLMGTLFEDNVGNMLLKLNPAALAASAIRAAETASRTNTGKPVSHHAAPTVAEVSSARHALAAYVAAHPSVASPAASTGAVVSAPSAVATTSASTTSSTSGTHSTSSSSTSTSTHVIVVTEEPLPPAMAIFMQSTRNPYLGTFGPGPGAEPPFGMASSRASSQHGAVAEADPSKSYSYAAPSSGSSSSKSHSSHHTSHSSSTSSSSSSSGSSHHK